MGARPDGSSPRLRGVGRAKTKKEAVELGLRTLVQAKRQERMKACKGKLKWEGNLDQMRMP